MAQHKLTALRVAREKTPGRHADGGGLNLVVKQSGQRSWVYRYKDRATGKVRDVGLGSLDDVGLAEARARVATARAAHVARKDVAAAVAPPRPVAARSESAKPTFAEMADRLLADITPGFRSPKHAAQWEMSLRVYCAPLRVLPVDTITTEDVLGVLRPIWSDKNETASRVRGRIERVLSASKALGHRSGENPAAWGDHLELILPTLTTTNRGHHAAMPVDDVPPFVARLRALGATPPLALEFIILTALRSGEVLRSEKADAVIEGLRWTEVDFKTKVLTIPQRRMKAKVEHQVPLSARALEVLEIARLRQKGFPSENGPWVAAATAASCWRSKSNFSRPNSFRGSSLNVRPAASV